MKTNIRSRILRIILIIELGSLAICLLAASLYHLQKLENKSQLFLDAARSDYLNDDSRSLQQKIQIAISGHEFKRITFLKDNVVIQPTSLFDITLSKPILAQTNDPKSAVGYAYFAFSLESAFTEAFFAWIFISLILLLVIPLIQKHLANQIRVDLETQQAKALATLATQIAHDIRSPLSAIRMISAVSDLNTSEARELMNSAAIRIDEIAQDLVDTAKRNKVSSFELETVDLSKMLKTLVATKKLEYKYDESVKIGLHINSDLNIFANKKELNRVLSNIINNSVEAKHKNQINIDIKAEQKNENALICITDNGGGMPQETINQILKGNYQSTKTGNSGLGLGLKHTFQVVQQMHGSVMISSQIDLGTILTLQFKLAD